MKQFNIYYMVNFMNSSLAVPYSRVAMACSYFKGDKVEEWASDQVILLQEKVHLQGRDPNDEGLWLEFKDNFF